jgi:type I restriction enzyme, S subunit
MSGELEPYPAYRMSGVPWLQDVPHHWTVWRAKRLFSLRKEFARADDVQLAATQAYGVIPQAEFEQRVGRRVVRISMHLEKRRRVQMGDFVISMRSFQGGLERAWASGAIRSSYVVLKPGPDVEVGYFAQLFKSSGYIRALQSTANFIRDGQDLNFSNFSAIDLPLPPREEQTAIARYLDHANWRIDHFIRAKKKLIALLNEQKQAIIHRAVTRGLDPDVPLKDSGVPWLGEIPAHWHTLRSKHVFREVDKRSEHGEETHLSMSQKMGLVPSSTLSERRLMSKTYIGGKLCEKGDLVLNRLKAHLGVFALATEPGVISPDYTVFRPIIALDPKYFEAVYRTPACRVVLRQKAKGIVEGFWRLYTDDFYNIRVPVPPHKEQREIIEYLDDELTELYAALSQAEREISLIREYRERLIADVVTGQLDVRAAVMSLPEVTPETIDEVEFEDEESENEADDVSAGEAA